MIFLCTYDSDGDLVLGKETFNYGADPLSFKHALCDVLPGLKTENFGSKGNGGTVPGYTTVLACPLVPRHCRGVVHLPLLWRCPCARPIGLHAMTEP